MKFTENKQIQQVKDTYNRIAEEFSDTRKASWPEFEKIFPNLKQGNILDIGCGNGRLYAHLPENLKKDYLGVDLSDKLIEIAKNKHPEAKFETGNFLNLPAGKFKNIVAIASFHHLPSVETRKLALENIQSSLTENGDLFITVWNLYQKKYLPYIDKNGDSQIPWGDNKIPRYYYAFKEDEIVQLIKESNFKIIEFQKGNNFYIHARKN